MAPFEKDKRSCSYMQEDLWSLKMVIETPGVRKDLEVTMPNEKKSMRRRDLDHVYINWKSRESSIIMTGTSQASLPPLPQRLLQTVYGLQVETWAGMSVEEQ